MTQAERLTPNCPQRLLALPTVFCHSGGRELQTVPPGTVAVSVKRRKKSQARGRKRKLCHREPAFWGVLQSSPYWAGHTE